MARRPSSGDHVGRLACLRADLVDTVFDGKADDERDIDRQLDELLPVPGSDRESWHLRRLRALHGHGHDGSDMSLSGAAIASSSDSAGGTRTTTCELGQDRQPLETELYWRSGRLIWSRSGLVMRTFMFEEQIRWACWAWMDMDGTWEANEGEGSAENRQHSRYSKGVQRALCIFLQSSMVIHFPHTGQEYAKRLDFDVYRVFDLDVGLLIQRRLEREDRRRLERLHYDGEDHILDGEDDMELLSLIEPPLPNLFYLRRPLDEMKPVQLVDDITTTNLEETDQTCTDVRGTTCWTKRPSRLFNEVEDSILFVSKRQQQANVPNVLVTASAQRDKIRIYAFVHSCQPLTMANPLRAGQTTKGSLAKHATNVQNGKIVQDTQTNSNLPRPRMSSVRGRMPSHRKSHRIDSSTRTSIGGPRSSMAAERSKRISSGASRRPSGGLVPIYNPGMVDDVEMEGAEESGIHEVMQLLDELDEGDENGEIKRLPVSSTSMRRQGSRLRTAASVASQPMHAMSAAAAAPSGSTSHIMRTPFSKSTLPSSDDWRSSSRPRLSSAVGIGLTGAGAEQINAPSMAATLSQQDEASRITQNVGHFNRPSLFRGVTEDDGDTFVRLDSGKENDWDTDAQVDGLPVFAKYGRGFAALSLIEEVACPGLKEVRSANVKAFMTATKDDSVLHIVIPFASQILRRRLVHRPRLDGEVHLCSEALIDRRYDGLCNARPASAQQNSHDILIRSTDGNDTLIVSAEQTEGGDKDIGLNPAPFSDQTYSAEEVKHECPFYANVGLAHRQKVSSRLFPQDRLTEDVIQMWETSPELGKSCNLRADWIAEKQSRRKKPRSDWEVLESLLSPAVQRDEETREARTPWEVLLQTSTHCNRSNVDDIHLPLVDEPSWKGPEVETSAGSLCSDENAAHLLVALNHVGQEVRLDMSRTQKDLPRIADLIIRLARRFNWPSWCSYWIRLGAKNQSLPSRRSSPNVPEGIIFDIYDHLRKVMRGEESHIASSTSLQLTSRLAWVYAGFARVTSDFPTMSGNQSSRQGATARSVVELMLEHGVSNQVVRNLPFAIALPLLEACQTCKLDPPAKWSPSAYMAIGRRDLALQIWSRSLRSEDPSEILPHGFSPRKDKSFGLPKLPAICYQLFNKDHRLTDVANMLQTARAVATKGPPESNSARLDEETIAEQQKRIFLSVSDRIKATSVGRGMFLLASERLRTAEQIRLARVCLRIRMLCHCIVQHREPDPDSAEMEWPEFHNGVAQALQLATDGMQVESSWIYSQTNNEFTARHAGFVFGMGLQGQLCNLGKIHAHHYLSNRHPATTIGLLLGIAVSFVGTCDVMAKALMSIHLAHTLPAHSKPLRTTMLEQSAALVGLGVVFMGSNDRWARRMTLKALGTDLVMTDDNQMARRECFSLSAGFALGLICLGKGREAVTSVEVERDMVPPLERLIKSFSTDARSSSSATVNKDPSISAGRAADYDAFKWRPDISLTSTPATLALALIFMRSNRSDIAAKLSLPSTDGHLDEIRPDILQARVLGRSLIMWDSIRPTKAWLEEALPECIRYESVAQVGSASEKAQLAFWNMRAGAILALGLKYAGSSDLNARACLLEELTVFQINADSRAVTYFDKVRQHALRSAIDVILTSLAIVFAGSGEVEILQIIRKVLYKVDTMRYGNYMASTMAVGMLFLGAGRYTLASSDVAIAALLIAFYPRYPINAQDNRAHLQAYRHLWIMAVDSRLLSVEDVESGETSSTPLEVLVRKQESRAVLYAKTPCVLPHLESIQTIHLASNRYLPSALDVGGNVHHRRALIEAQTLFASRHAAALSHDRDPLGRASLLEQMKELANDLPVPQLSTSDIPEALTVWRMQVRSLVDQISTLTDRSAVVNLLRSVIERQDSASRTGREDHLDHFTVCALLDCLRQDKMEILPRLIALFTGARQCLEDNSLCGTASTRAFAVDLAFLRHFVEQDAHRVVGHRDALVPRIFIDRLALTVEEAQIRRIDDGSDVRQRLTEYARAIAEPDADSICQATLSIAGLLARANVPALVVLLRLRQHVLKFAKLTSPRLLPSIAESALRAAKIEMSTVLTELFVHAWIT